MKKRYTEEQSSRPSNSMRHQRISPLNARFVPGQDWLKLKEMANAE